MMSEDFLSLQLDKPPSKAKSVSELQKHAIDDVKYEKKPIDRANFLLSKGDDLQKLSVIESLPQLLDFDSNGTITKIIPKIQRELANSSSEFNIITSQMYQVLFKMQVPINFINPIIQGNDLYPNSNECVLAANKIWDSLVSGAWMETLLVILPELPEEIVKNEVLKCVLARCQPTKSTYARATSCKLLGQICVHPKMSAVQVQRDIVPLVHSLCQDCLYEIRAAICRELPYVASGISKLGEPINLMPLLVELSNDENSSVRSAAINGLVLVVPLLTPVTIKTTIIPLFKQLCSKSTTQDDVTYFTIAKMYGKLIETLLGNLSAEDAVWFMDFYKHLCLTGSSDDLDSDLILGTSCRAYCANDLPVMTVLMKRLLPQEITYWYKIFNDMSNDSNCLVRKAVAQHFDTISEILGNKNRLLKPDFIRLLKDDSEEVLQHLVPTIAAIIKHFAETQLISREVSNQSSLDIGRALVQCQTSVLKTNNYRLKVEFLMQLEKLPFYFNSEFIHKNFTTLLFNIASKGKARPVRVQAGKTLMIFLKYNVNEIHRKWIRETMTNELAQSRSCYTRIIYVKMCDEALTIFSGKYFKEHFFSQLLPLIAMGSASLRPKSSGHSVHTARIYQKGKKEPLVSPISSNSSNINTVSNNDNMSFLDKHFYIDAGIPLYDATLLEQSSNDKETSDLTDKTSSTLNMAKHNKDTVAENDITSCDNELVISADNELVISVENTDIENLSERDLKKLKITSNITDDVKVNLQKINQSKNSVTCSDGVKKRSKRLSCVFNNDRKEQTNKNILLKRRSLNIGIGDNSRIPVSSRSSTLTKSKSESINSLNSTVSSKIPAAKNRPLLDVNQVKSDLNSLKKDNKAGSATRNIRETVHIESSSNSNKIKDAHGVPKLSNLPVLIRSPK